MSFLNLRENYDRIILIFARSLEQFFQWFLSLGKILDTISILLHQLFFRLTDFLGLNAVRNTRNSETYDGITFDAVNYSARETGNRINYVELALFKVDLRNNMRHFRLSLKILTLNLSSKIFNIEVYILFLERKDLQLQTRMHRDDLSTFSCRWWTRSWTSWCMY